MNFEEKRKEMVQTQLVPRRITDPFVIKAFEKVPREKFVLLKYQDEAYADYPLPIGEGQTISQPFMAALMTQSLGLSENDNVLEIGTGSGYQAAILAEITKKVFTVERFAEISERAKNILDDLGYKNIFLNVGDGTYGWQEHSPYQAIIVTAAAPKIPLSLIEQLSEGGRMIIPVGGMWGQSLVFLQKTESGLKEKDLGGCVFVPLVGKFGWTEK